MKKRDSNKAIIATGAATSAAGTATALGGEAALWAVFSAGPGAALTGAAETSAFLAWVGGGSLAAGGGGMAAGSTILAALGPVGWTVAGIGAAATGYAIYKARKKNKK
ncbi:MAG: hypothetical protein ACI3ZP_01205 [Candidatus Cryptobacteroides sp.]